MFDFDADRLDEESLVYRPPGLRTAYVYLLTDDALEVRCAGLDDKFGTDDDLIERHAHP